MTTPNQQKKRNKIKKPKEYRITNDILRKQLKQVVEMDQNYDMNYQANYLYFERWLANNDVAIRNLLSETNRIKSEYVEHEIINDIIVFKETVDEDGKTINVFKEGVSQEDLDKAVTELLKQEVVVIP